MTTPRDLERRLVKHLHAEAPSRAPDWILRSALTTIDTTRQRRGLTALRRNLDMPTYAKLAAAAVVVIAVGVFALYQLAPPGPGGPSVPSPTPTPSPSAAPTSSPAPTTAPYVPPALTGAFTSDIHGISMSYPVGWTVQKATESWVETGFIDFRMPSGDFMYDPAKTDHLFLEVGSQPLGDRTFDQWSSAALAPEPDCTETEPVVVDGAEGLLSVCNWAFVASGGRGYIIGLYASGDDADLQTFDATTWFKEVLATVQLLPGDAVDLEPSQTP